MRANSPYRIPLWISNVRITVTQPPRKQSHLGTLTRILVKPGVPERSLLSMLIVGLVLTTMVAWLLKEILKQLTQLQSVKPPMNAIAEHGTHGSTGLISFVLMTVTPPVQTRTHGWIEARLRMLVRLLAVGRILFMSSVLTPA